MVPLLAAAGFAVLPSGLATVCVCLQVSDIVKVLSLSGSSYLAPFLQLKERIQQEAVAAEDNVRFLACLDGPCQQLSKATPQQIPALLPQVLNCIRMVWSFSKYYNTPDRIVGLLQKLSNEIINRCCSTLKVDDIFTGDVLGAMDMLQQSMAAGRCLGSNTCCDHQYLAHVPCVVLAQQLQVDSAY